MAEMGIGYGSECHLLRYLGRHRNRFDEYVLNATDADTIAWLDYPFDSSKTWLDGEFTGLDFLKSKHPARREWANVWPRQGNPPNWDAVGRIRRNGANEWLLVEAKANVQELKSSCKAKEEGGRPLIARTLAAVKSKLGVAEDRDWLNGYYQYCNRIAVLEILNRHEAPARLLFIYFVGDKGDATRTCPTDAAEWQSSLDAQNAHVGLATHHPLSNRVHELFLDVRGAAPLGRTTMPATDKPTGSGWFSLIVGSAFILLVLVFWLRGNGVGSINPNYLLAAWMIFSGVLMSGWGITRILSTSAKHDWWRIGQNTINFCVAIIAATFAILAILMQKGP
jgi:hypothetical protein